MMRRIMVCTAAVLLVSALSSCSNKTANQTTETSSDSLLASNPVEAPPGNLTPQTEYQPPQQAEEPPAPAPKKSAPAKHHNTSSSSTASHSNASSQPAEETGVLLSAGSSFNVNVQTQLTTETAHVGDTWTGQVKDNVIVGDRVAIPAGSTVTGTVLSSIPAKKGSRASLQLGVQSVEVNGKSYPVNASAENIVAGSPRARNVGAVVGGTAAGALIGKAVSGGGKGALIGGLIGGAAATGVVASSKGYQVTVKEGAELPFTVNQNVRVGT